ncbi:cysteine hydrolase family protein [Paenibacillus agricola]|uniref:Cysteine hydrolase n=1 Tax=Paenibacillus agricola TaxID=2716264 RepID=A0ABX0JDQ6_9BACL|nr:cysteine hydrolase [Paenibacillus agricola]NHN34073.1 cysteine hydrolase [Paenibacillus agricola]
MRYGNGENYWIVEGNHFDISRGTAEAATMEIEGNETLKFDPKRSALIIIDMQNFFCSSLLGRSDGAIKLVPAIASAIRSSRQLGMKIIWVNWGNRADTANLPPNMLYSRKRGGRTHIGEPLPDNLGLALVKDSWSAAIIDELAVLYDESDYLVDKYRTSGFPGTNLDQILRANGINTLFHTGVNTDQCVMFSLLDAAFLGYDNVLLTDCTATTSPSYAMEGAIYNMRGRSFMAVSESLMAASSLLETVN